MLFEVCYLIVCWVMICIVFDCWVVLGVGFFIIGCCNCFVVLKYLLFEEV